jgi:hypothetical protein
MIYKHYKVYFTNESGDLDYVESTAGEWDARETNRTFATSLAGGGSFLIKKRNSSAIIIPAKQISRIVFFDEIKESKE